MMLKVPRWLMGSGNRIGRRLMVLIIGFSSVITLVLTVVQLALEYRQLRTGIDRDLEGVSISVPSIAGSLWDFDEPQIQVALNSLLRVPNVVYVAVHTPSDGKRWEAGKVSDTDVVQRNFALRHQLLGQDTEIGRLQVVASLDAVFRQVATQALSILLSNGLKTFLVATFMALLFDRMVTRRLLRLQRDVTAMGQQVLTQRPKGGSEGMPAELDEIDAMAWHLERQSAELEQALLALSKTQAELRVTATAFESQEGMMITDASTVILQVNRAFTQITGFAPQDVVGRTPRVLKSGRHDKAFYQAMWETLQRTDRWHGEVWGVRKNGERYPKALSISAVRNQEGVLTHYVSAHRDITERKKAEERINELAFFDHLTGLPNRTLLLDRLRQGVATTTRSHNYGALLFIDLDDFKTLNDTLGHDVGDMLLKQVAQRLSQCVREGDTVARLGGDEFVIVLAGLSGKEAEAAAATETIADKILASFAVTHQLGSVAHHCTASIGVTLFKGDGTSVDNLMKQADLAMYKSKSSGRNLVRFFDPSLESTVKARVALETDMRRAIQEKEFLLHYQPQIVDHDRVIGAEALVRWQHPGRGLVSPAEFVPLAEETGLILPLGRLVLHEACSLLARWASQPEMAQLFVAVNVSPRQFGQADFVDQVLAVIRETGANPQRLKLELTEGLLVHNVDDVVEKMFALKAKGVRFSLDDFGTGYSSLAYLKRLPLDQLKIDQSFVREVLTDPNDAAIAKTIVTLAQSLGLNVIAEGVETPAQRDFLASAGCHTYQGYLFSRPLPERDFENFVRPPRGPSQRSR